MRPAVILAGPQQPVFIRQSAPVWITIVTDVATWNALCEASQQRQDLGADWIRQNGELIIGGDWIIESGITDAEQLEITAAPRAEESSLIFC